MMAGLTRKHVLWIIGAMTVIFITIYNPLGLLKVRYHETRELSIPDIKLSKTVTPVSQLNNPKVEVSEFDAPHSPLTFSTRVITLNATKGVVLENHSVDTNVNTGDSNTKNTPTNVSEHHIQESDIHTWNVNESGRILNKNTVTSSPEVTLVTAFFDIGPFPKGYKDHIRTSESYFKWMDAYQSVDNPLVVYTDSEKVYSKFLKLRQCFPANRTQIHLINRTDLWVFSLRTKIMAVFRQPHYPIHYPNTYNENYTCMTHAKFEVLRRTANENPFKTKYFAWVDLGLYRHHNISELFHVALPPNFDDSKMAVFNVKPFVEIPVDVIVKQNLNWLGGGIVVGTQNVILEFTEDYLKAVRMILEHNLMNVEQHILYAMYTEAFYFKPRTSLQVYNKGEWKGSEWFLLAEITRVVGLVENSTFIKECQLEKN